MKRTLYKTYLTGLIVLYALGISTAVAQQIPGQLQSLFTMPEHYIVQHTNEMLTMDGRLNENAWAKAVWTNDFVDIEGALKPKPRFRTQVKMLWNDSLLFVAAQMQEPQVWAKQQHHDDIIYLDNDFEIFIDPDNDTHQYFEIEVNALNKIFDLFLTKPYRNGGDALIGWNVNGLKSGVKVQGTLNKLKDTDKGWTVEMAIPLKELRMGFAYKAPAEGTIWRINFSRVEWKTKLINGKVEKIKDDKGRNFPEDNWVWSVQGLVNMHYPERWGYLQFTRKNDAVFELPYAEKQKRYLWLAYYLQKEYQKKSGHYAGNLHDLDLPAIITVNGATNTLQMEATNRQFNINIFDEAGSAVSINEDGLIKTIEHKP
ncbi:carbohydrate-binding family 9-like protein [Mucilaginibacter koreensis]